MDKRKAELKAYVMNPDNGFAHVPVVLANVFEQLMKFVVLFINWEQMKNSLYLMIHWIQTVS